MSFLEAWFSDVEHRHPDIAALVGAVSAAAADGDRGLFAERNGGDWIRVYAIQRAPIDWIAASGLAADDTAGIRALLRDAYAAWSPRLRRLMTDNDGAYVDRPILALTSATTVAEAVRAYEETMLPRSVETARALEGGTEHLLSAEVPDFGHAGSAHG